MDSDLNLIVGKTIESVVNEGNETILFVCRDGDAFEAHHMQDCCETVVVHDISGDLQTLVGFEIIAAEETVSNEWPDDVPKEDYSPESFTESFTWTTHKFETAVAIVLVRWLGTSNGYYSESVHFGRTHKPIST